ncbi:hypothetical protein GCM10017044_27930 [Kordiimonas sediminis]|uniref:Uncharacterized protein n=1 Tax=Kordiimonas sediminis TaxID=1735581 RepID=A0A919AX92_9PROT|nr:DUF6768 family protein [Kordiimonas sediminis]GHF30938.1 hypothetical protein GCM10017044_27930 [Kordiimonas sediminis]
MTDIKDPRLPKKDQPGLFPLLWITMKGPLGRWLWLVMMFTLSFTAIFFVAAIEFWQTSDPLTAIKSGFVALFCALMVAMMKLWMWLEMEKTSLFLLLKASDTEDEA